MQVKHDLLEYAIHTPDKGTGVGLVDNTHSLMRLGVRHLEGRCTACDPKILFIVKAAQPVLSWVACMTMNSLCSFHSNEVRVQSQAVGM